MPTRSRWRSGSAAGRSEGVDRDPAGTDRLVEVALDPSAGFRRGPDYEHERRIAIHDLLEENSFAPVGGSGGPYRLRIGREEGRLLLDVENDLGVPQVRAVLPLASLRRTLRDYATICESYHEAIRTAPRSRIEAMDMGRRACHNDGAEIIRRELAGTIDIDETTARQLFTLVHALHVRG